MSSRRIILEDSDDEIELPSPTRRHQQQQDPSGIKPDNNGTFSAETLESVAASPAFQPYINGERVLAQDHEAFINTIHDPTSTDSGTSPPTEHAVLLTVDLLRKAEKKWRIKMFKQKKAHVVFGLWWDYCLANLKNNCTADATVVKILIALLKFVHQHLSDIIKTKKDVVKANTMWNVDLEGHVEGTKKALDAASRSCTELKEEVQLAVNQLKNLPEKAPSSSTKAAATNEAVAKAPEQRSSAPASQSTQRAPSDHRGAAPAEDRQKAASLARIEALKKQQFRRFSAAAPPAGGGSPPRPSRDSSGQSGGYGRNDSGQSASSGYGRKPPPESLGNSNYAASLNRNNSGYERPTLNAAASSNSAPRSHDSGYGRRPPESAGSNHYHSASSANREDSGFDRRHPSNSSDKNNVSAAANDGWARDNNSSASAAGNDGWGRSSNAPAATNGDWGRNINSSATGNDGWGRNANSSATGNDGWGRNSSTAPSSAKNSSAAAGNANDDRARAPAVASGGYNGGYGRATSPPINIDNADDSGNYDSDGWGRAPVTEAAAKPSVARTTVDNNKDQLWGQTLSGPAIPPYPGSNANTLKGHDSHANWEAPLKSPGSEGYNRSDHEPSPRGGIIRNNQPVGGFGDGNNDHSQQPNQDENHAEPRSSHDRRDSRASSHRSGSFERRNDDRRGDYDDRRSRGSSYRSDSPSSSRYNRHDSRGFDDRGRDSRDRFEDRKRDREESSLRGSRPPKPCKFFFSREGCHTGSMCRFSHEEDDRKPQADRRSDRSDYGRGYEDDRGSEEGEVCSTKRSRPNDNRNVAPSANNAVSSLPPSGGAGRGRGRNVNLPAWMTNGLATAGVPTGVAASSTNQSTAAPLLSNADLASVLSSVNGNSGSAAPAGRGSGRGNIDNRPAWMTRSGDSGPVGANGNSAPPVPSGMNGRFAPPPSASVRNDLPAQQGMGRGRGRGRGTDNRPAWMTRGAA